jgi:ArsR family transcriptional regulator
VNDSTVIELCRLLGEPVRFAIVKELSGGPSCACTLAAVASVSPSLLSHHLKVLRDAGLIAGERRGRWIDYSLTSAARERLSQTLLPEKTNS